MKTRAARRRFLAIREKPYAGAVQTHPEGRRLNAREAPVGPFYRSERALSRSERVLESPLYVQVGLLWVRGASIGSKRPSLG